MAASAHINREVLRWAIDRARRSVDTANEQRWLESKELPTIRQAQAIAKKLAIPFGYLFLSDYPDDDLPIPDLRTRRDEAVLDPSLDLREQLDWVAAKQQWFAELRRKGNGDPLPFVASVNITQEIETVAQDISGVLNLTSIRSTAKSWSDYLTLLCRQAEATGILVMRSGVVGMNNRRRLNADEFQGFAIADAIAPLIFINTNDYVAATIFTFAHELAHIWVGESGVTLSEEDGTSSGIDVEQFCNKVAAELLVPGDEFNYAWSQTSPGIRTDRLARTFRVSTIVILRRALDRQLISRREFFEQLDVEQQKHTPRARGSGGSGFSNILARNGYLLARTAVSGALEGRVGYAEAAEVLGVKVQTLKNLASFMSLR